MTFRTGLLALFICTTIVPSTASEMPQAIAFENGATSTAVRARIVGDAGTAYSVAAKAGQTLSVRMTTDNSSNYFNIRREGEDATLFVGSLAGRPAALEIVEDGTYLIDVYLMRNAARRCEQAGYTLNIALEN